MNFNMFRDLGLYLVNGQFLVQGRREYMTLDGTPISYKPETFLITSDKKRAEKKLTRLSLHTCKLGG